MTIGAVSTAMWCGPHSHTRTCFLATVHYVSSGACPADGESDHDDALLHVVLERAQYRREDHEPDFTRAREGVV